MCDSVILRDCVCVCAGVCDCVVCCVFCLSCGERLDGVVVTVNKNCVTVSACLCVCVFLLCVVCVIVLCVVGCVLTSHSLSLSLSFSPGTSVVVLFVFFPPFLPEPPPPLLPSPCRPIRCCRVLVCVVC